MPPFDPNQLDAISVAQALRDVETANARVIDLSRRLIESERRRRELSDELERLRLGMGQSPTAVKALSLGRKLARSAIDKAVATAGQARSAVKKAVIDRRSER